MSKVVMTEISRKRCLLDMPHDVLFQVFRRLPKDKLYAISRLCVEFRDAAGDTRLWKNVFIMYEPFVFAFEDIYSEPWPVQVIDLSYTQIKSPVNPKPDQVVNVTKLNLSSITAEKVTLEAILAKYQTTELYLDFKTWVGPEGHIMQIAPEAFSRQTNLEVLSLGIVIYQTIDVQRERRLWLAQVLGNCKKLKTLDFSQARLTKFDMQCFVEHLPASLEKLLLSGACPEDSFFDSLVESAPNLREIELPASKAKCPSLLKFQFLEVLYIIPYSHKDLGDLHMYLTKFPALKTVYIIYDPFLHRPWEASDNFGKLKRMSESHGISIVCTPERSFKRPECLPYSKNGNLWKVPKVM